MLRYLLLLALVIAAPAAEPVHTAPGKTEAVPAIAEIDQLVATFNPNVWETKDGKPVHRIDDAFASPASDVARKVSGSFWFSLLIFSPFLILPQALLIYVIFKFRDRKDGRKAATFTGNHTLEIVWTAIPCVALLIVTVPAVQHITWMELPPDDSKVDVVPIEVVGKQFAWKYRYMKEAAPQYSLDVATMQEPLVLPKDRTVVLNITSEDVNHAWWVPAFGVKKDGIIGRYTYVWFTPDTLGTYKGQCAELCGINHGLMVISAVVVDQDRFALWLDLLHRRDATAKVWSTLRDGKATRTDIEAAVAKYLAHDGGPASRFALQYWVASNYASTFRGLDSGTGTFRNAQVKPELMSEAARNRALIAELLGREHAATTTVSADSGI